MQENELKSGSNTELKKRLEKAIINIDKGSNDEFMLEMCSLIYLPNFLRTQREANWRPE